MSSSRAVMTRPSARGRMAPAGHVDSKKDVRLGRAVTGHPGPMSDLSQALDVLPGLELVWRRCPRGSERLEKNSPQIFDFHPFLLDFLPFLFTCLGLPGDWRSHGCWFESRT